MRGRRDVAVPILLGVAWLSSACAVDVPGSQGHAEAGWLVPEAGGGTSDAPLGQTWVRITELDGRGVGDHLDALHVDDTSSRTTAPG